MLHQFKRILGVTDIYPSPHLPEEGVFVQSLFRQLKLCGYPVRVLNPRSWLRQIATGELFKSKGGKNTENDEEVLTPGYLTVSSRLFSFKRIGGRLTFQYYRQAVRRSLPVAVNGCNLVYAHFFRSGWAAIDSCEATQKDCFVALGESNLEEIIAFFGQDIFAKNLLRFAGVIAVSKANEKLCRDLCPSIGDRLIYLPNAVDHTLFFPRDRREARQMLNLPVNKKIIVFCGHFVKRKGAQRLLTALERTPDVYGIFLGRGPETPRGTRVLHAGPVDHLMIPWWFSAADLFVLPSTSEGMSNAIVEALACGLPVVVSDLPFNHEFLGNDCAVFVNPYSADDISRAISSLYENQKRYSLMASAALSCANYFKLASRAQNILDFVAGHTHKG